MTRHQKIQEVREKGIQRINENQKEFNVPQRRSSLKPYSNTEQDYSRNRGILRNYFWKPTDRQRRSKNEIFRIRNDEL